jgi:hypothetical protein
LPRRWQEAGVKTTVEQALKRGSGPHDRSFVSGLPQARSIRTRRAWRLRALVMPPRRVRPPSEDSLCTRPKYAISCRGLAKRVKSPTSATKITAANRIPRASPAKPRARLHGPGGHELLDLAHEARNPRRGVRDGADVVLQDDLLGGMVEAQVGEPTPVGLGPITAGMNPPMAEQKRLQSLTPNGQGMGGCSARSHESPHRLMGGVRNPNRRQLAGPVQRGKGRGITAVGLDPIARPPAESEPGHDDAVATEFSELPEQTITARAGLVTQAQLLAVPPQTLDQPPHHLGAVLHGSQMPPSAIPTARRDRHCDRRPMDIQAHLRDVPHQARLLCVRPCAGRSNATLDRGIR